MKNYKKIVWQYRLTPTEEYRKGTCLQSAVNQYFEFKIPLSYLNPEYKNKLFIQNYVNIISNFTNCKIELDFQKRTLIVKITNKCSNVHNTYKAMVLVRPLGYPVYYNIPKHLSSLYSLTLDFPLSLYLTGLEAVDPYYGILNAMKVFEISTKKIKLSVPFFKKFLKNIDEHNSKFNSMYFENSGFVETNKNVTEEEVTKLSDLIRDCKYEEAVEFYNQLKNK